MQYSDGGEGITLTPPHPPLPTIKSIQQFSTFALAQKISAAFKGNPTIIAAATSCHRPMTEQIQFSHSKQEVTPGVSHRWNFGHRRRKLFVFFYY